MPGISGIISRRPVEDCQRAAVAMVRSMEHEPFYTSGTHFVPELGVYAGWTAHENSFAAGQVFLNEQRDIALLLSGECFVDQEARSALKRRGHCLEESNNWLVHLYEEEGEQFIEKLNGLFSGLLIDKRQRKTFLFNDRYALERIYCYQTENGTYFASEAKALLSVVPELRTFDHQGVAEFLTVGCTLEERTLFRRVQMLPGGSLWLFENGACRKRKYFSTETWESQPILSDEAFTAKLEETFNRVLPRYFESQTKIGISLTGGLDSRMIMACRPGSVRNVTSYTFSGESGETFDDRLAAQVAKVCGLDHRLLRINADFFSDFGSHVDRTVYVTDGYFGATGAHEIYLNRQARELASVRLTGNYGSEVLRGTSTFKPVGLSPAMFNPGFKHSLDCAAGSITNGSVHPITFAAFREISWNLFGGLAASRSQVTFRTPFLDNELVALAYQAPESLRKSPLPSWRLINANNTLLSRMPTDRRAPLDSPRLAAMLRRAFSEATFKLDYLNNEGWPNWLSPFDSIFTRVTSNLRILGLHKYLHYRSWFRRELAGYLQDAITKARNRQTSFWDPDFLKQMVEDHTSGRKNYVCEINAVLTLEAAERLLFRGFPDKLEAYTICTLPDPSRSNEDVVLKGPAKPTEQLAELKSTSISESESYQINHRRKSRAVSRNGVGAPKWLPTFLGIGSMRCGSTWLYEVLKLHPDIRMSDCKEMDFFFMPQMLQHDLRWYEAHFKPNNGSEPKPVRGEISPRYSRLKAWQVGRIAELLPELRIILTLRHPIERVWSQTVYDFGRLQGREIRKVKPVEFLRQLERARNRFSSDYLRTIKIWSNAFGRDSLHISLFDELRDDPEIYVNDILRHVGVSAPWRVPPEFMQNKVWSTKALVNQARDIPELVQWYIADQLLEPTERLNELLNGRVSSWVEELRDIRGRTRLSWRILKEINRTILSRPEGLAYEAYHAILDIRLWRRWRRLQTTHLC
jgi:asparagine synthase (glutamine-hydrolysing)